MIDLHCHSKFSDGVLSPVDLVAKATEANLKILALTDHDTIEGLAELHEAALSLSLTIINGIELSASWKKHDIHVIGLHFNVKDCMLQKLIQSQNESRITRALQVAKLLHIHGCENAYSKACEIAGHERAGRAHFAQVLVNEKMVINKQSAFTRFLGRGAPAYTQANWAGITEIVHCIRQAGGQAVLAHPLKYALTRQKLKELIVLFKSAGGEAMEVVSGFMTNTQIQELQGLCLRFELFSSTGSDYHGDGVSRVGLGKQLALPLNCKPIWEHPAWVL